MTGEVAGAETVRLSEQRPGDWLSLENGRCGAVKVVGNVVQGSGVDSHPALARGCLPAGVRCAWRVTLLSDDDYYVGVATSGVPIHSWLGGLADVRSVYLSKSRTCAIVGKGSFGQGFAPALRKGGSICFYYDGQHSLIAICRDAAGMSASVGSSSEMDRTSSHSPGTCSSARMWCTTVPVSRESGRSVAVPAKAPYLSGGPILPRPTSSLATAPCAEGRRRAIATLRCGTRSTRCHP